ncbi:hypothetical protein TASIC1_0010033600 [Trichoderma asperellum]|uniref:Uncharacterized protein n=1 Tax=Trichoderma asperellum TaxID=101201 RepID=A0A6V8R2Y2_TRIAP|nr:hypothetical protein TASIC1_0010033600 [Trichoderma asperellum]
MAGGKGKSSGGKSSGGKTSAEGAKKQQSHSARAGLQVSFWSSDSGSSSSLIFCPLVAIRGGVSSSCLMPKRFARMHAHLHLMRVPL